MENIRRVLAACACAVSCHATPAAVEHGLEFSHDSSIAQHWPFGLGDVTTKIVAEPAAKDGVASSYWLVRSKVDASARELVAELSVEAEFPDSAFAPIADTDYRVIVGTDQRNATTRALGRNLFEIRSPVDANTGAAGFALRAEFLGDTDGPEPPKALLVRIVRVVEASTGRALALGPRSVARWLIVDPD